MARWYDPQSGRFVSPDSIVPEPGNPQSLNRFAYAGNNPLRYSDPTGHYTFEESPDDRWHLSDPRVRSAQWYTQPEWDPEPQSDAEIIVATTSPVWVPVATVVGVGLLADVAAPAVETAVRQATEWVVTLGWQLYDRITTGMQPENVPTPWPGPEGGRQGINELDYSVHALRRMAPPGTEVIVDGVATALEDARGVPPSVVENAVRYGQVLASKVADRFWHVYDQVWVLTDWAGKVIITVEKKGH